MVDEEIRIVLVLFAFVFSLVNFEEKERLTTLELNPPRWLF